MSQVQEKQNQSSQGLNKWLKNLLWLGLFIAVIVTVDTWRSQSLPQGQVPQITSLDLQGQALDVAALSQQQPVLVYYWATWCPVCQFVTPSVEWLSSSIPVISVAIRSPQIQPYVDAKSLT
ncbi:MAG: thioredoxin domain-containing protein, partial [Vibrio sp.]